MLFTNQDNPDRVEGKTHSVRVTSKGQLRLKVSDVQYPDQIPGHITFTKEETKQIFKALKEAK